MHHKGHVYNMYTDPKGYYWDIVFFSITHPGKWQDLLQGGEPETENRNKKVEKLITDE